MKCQFALFPALNKLYNSVLSSGIHPESWLNSIIIPNFKHGDNNDPGNYREITVSGCIGKLFNSILNKRLGELLKVNNLLADEELGFKK